MKALFLALMLLPNISFAISRLDLVAGRFEVAHNRPDLKVEKLWIQTACFNSDGTNADSHECAYVTVDGMQNTTGLIEFLASSGNPNHINTKSILIQNHNKAGQFFCIGMKVLFENFPNRCDSVLYTEMNDRYSIHSFCTVRVLPENTPASARFSNRRFHAWDDFSLAYAKPIRLDLTSSSRPDWCDD